jgi:trans-aconitate methyltransferase
VIDYDAERQLPNERFRSALGIQAADRLLEIGCGTGQTTREQRRSPPPAMGWASISMEE